MLNEDKKFFAEKIKKSRIRLGLTQEQFAEKIGLSSKQVSRIECGNFLPLLPTFFRIVKVLNLTLNDFGIDTIGQENKIRNELMQLIHTLNDSELESYYNLLQTLTKNFAPIKKSKNQKLA